MKRCFMLPSFSVVPFSCCRRRADGLVVVIVVSVVSGGADCGFRQNRHTNQLSVLYAER